MRFIWGLVWIIVGFGLIKYSTAITNFFGHVPWAENHLGSGGTYTMHKLIGLLVIFLGFMYMFGLFGAITRPLAPLFGGPG